MTFPRYPKYKDSGVEWLGEVPEQWKTVRLKTVASHNNEVLDEETPPETEILYVDISGVDGMSGIKTKEITTFSAAPSRARRRVRHGDVIISTVRTYLRAIARISAPESNLIVSTGFAVIRPSGGLSANFLGHLLFARYFIEEVIARSTGVSYPAINASDLMNISVAIPPPDEQEPIAAFLDRETAKIDALVTEQQRLIDLLKEKRQTVISHAVTKGLNPDAPLKASGIDWLGDVPAHWGISRLKYATTVIVDCPHETPVYSDDGPYLVVRTADLDAGRIDPTGMYRVSQSEYQHRIRRLALRNGDIVYGREGERWGHAGLITEDDRYCLGQRMMQFRADSRLSYPPLLMWQLNARCTYLQGSVDTVGATAPHVNVGTIRNYYLTAPPLDEQRAIADHIKEQGSRFDALISAAQSAIALLQERRAALISAAVTGQIDVRHLAPSESS